MSTGSSHSRQIHSLCEYRASGAWAGTRTVTRAHGFRRHRGTLPELRSTIQSQSYALHRPIALYTRSAIRLVSSEHRRP
eukprot:3940550-Rhodomonas_salina.6